MQIGNPNSPPFPQQTQTPCPTAATAHGTRTIFGDLSERILDERCGSGNFVTGCGNWKECVLAALAGQSVGAGTPDPAELRRRE